MSRIPELLSLAVLAGLVALASCDQGRSTVDNGWPPDRFRQDATVRVAFTSPDAIAAACGSTDPDLIIEGCTRLRSNGDHLMILPNPCVGERGGYNRIGCHEIGHLNGWPGDHGP